MFRRPALAVLIVLLALAAPALAAGLVAPAAPTDAVPTDCGATGDAGGSAATAHRVEAPVDCRGHAAGVDTDSYVVHLDAAAGDRLDVRVDWDGYEGQDLVESWVINPYEQLCVSSPSGKQRCTGWAFSLPLDETGDWRITVYAWYKLPGTYRLTVDTGLFPPQDDCGTGSDTPTPWDGQTPPLVALPIDCTGDFPAGSFDEHDTYRFVSPVAGRIDATAAPLGAGVHLCIRLASGVTCHWDPFHTDTEHVRAFVSEGEEFRVSVSSDNTDGRYGLKVTATLYPSQDDCGTGSDAQTALVTLPVVCDGTLLPSFQDDHDRYRFDVPAGKIAVADVHVTRGQTQACLHPDDGTRSICQLVGANETRELARFATADGTFDVNVGRYWSHADTDYTLDIRLEDLPPAPHDDCGSGADSGSVSGAVALTTGAACEGQMQERFADFEDAYVLDAQAGETLALQLATLAGGDADFCIYGPDDAAAPLACRSVAPTTPERYTFAVEVSGAYRVLVTNAAGSPNYRLEAALVPQDDCGSGRDASGTAAGAVALAVGGQTCEGSFPPGVHDAVDRYLLDGRAGDAIVAGMLNQPLFDYDLCLLRPDGTSAKCASSRAWGPESIQHVLDEDGVWSVTVRPRTGSGEYQLSVSTTQA